MKKANGWLHRLRHRFSGNLHDIEAAELRADTLVSGATPVDQCCTGERVVISGTVRSVTLPPRDQMPAYEAEIYDGSGFLRVIWLGRRRIGGVTPGRMISLTGRVTQNEGRATMFNPRYQLRPGVEG